METTEGRSYESFRSCLRSSHSRFPVLLVNSFPIIDPKFPWEVGIEMWDKDARWLVRQRGNNFLQSLFAT